VTVPPIAEQVRKNLHTRGDLADLLRWTHNNAWQKQNQPDRKRRDLSITDTARQALDPDYVPGGRHDIGIGNDPMKHSWAAAVHAVAEIEVRAAHCAHLAGHTHAALVRPDPHAALSLTMLAVRRSQINTTNLADNWPTQLAVELAVLDELQRIDRLITDTVHRLKTDWAKGKSDGIAIDPDCRNAKRGCPNKAMHGHSRCGSCDRWHRNTGQEKPTKLLRENVDPAKAAKGRRLERGEGWGDA